MSLVKKFFNFVVVLFFIATPTVTYWRGSWYILDLYSFSKCGLICAWITTGISFGVIYVVVFFHKYNKAYIENSRVRSIFLFVLFYPLAFMIVTSWRGFWLLLDHYTTISLFSGIVSHFVGFFIVLLTKTASSIVSAPGYCIMERFNDPADCVLQIKVCFSNDKSHWPLQILFRLLNCFVTVFVVGAAVVSYWRGTWVIMDLVSMGQASSKLRSSIISTVVGFGIVLVCYCTSESLLKSRILMVHVPFSLLWRTLEHGFVYILGFGVVNVWRGMWYLEDIFLLPELKPAYAALICHVFGVCILFGLQGIVNLIGSPAGCRVHGSETLEGFDMGTFLEPDLRVIESENEGNSSAYAQESINVG